MVTEENVHEYIQTIGTIMQRGNTMPLDGGTLHFTTQEELWCLLRPTDRQRYFEMLGEMERAHLIHWDRTGYIEVTKDGEGLYDIAKESRAANPGLGAVVVSSAVSGATMQTVSHFLHRLMNSNRQENPMRNQNPLGNLPPKAARMWEHVYESAQDRGLNKGAAAAQAWCSVKRQYYKKGERWRKRKQPLSREEYPPGCEPYRGRRGRSRAANPDDPEESLLTLLDTLRASYDFYREAHWTVHGNDYYGNHLLMQRLYEETAPMVDGLAEMIVGSYGPESIANHESRSDVIMEAVATGYGSDERQPDNVAASLVMAQEVQVAIDESYASLKEAGELTHAWDDFLMSIAQIKATHIYLLRQATDMEPYVELDVAARKLKNKLLR